MSRPVGSKNKSTLAKREKIQRLLESGVTPLEVIMQAMRGELPDNEDTRFKVHCASLVAPYVHPRLASQEIRMDADVRSTNVVSDKPLTPAEWLEKYGDKTYTPDDAKTDA